MKDELALELNKYISKHKTQEECIGFIAGFETAWEQKRTVESRVIGIWQTLFGVLALVTTFILVILT